MPSNGVVEWHGERTGWLYNYHVTTLLPGGGSGGGGGAGKQDAAQQGEDEVQKANGESALHLFFIDLDGETFDCPVKYCPYFFVAATEGHEREVELGITGAFGSQLQSVTVLEKEDLGMVNHLSGKKRKYIKLTFLNTNDLTAVRSKIDAAIQRNKQLETTSAGGAMGGGIDLDFRGSLAHVPMEASAPGGAFTSTGDDVSNAQAGGSTDKLTWMRWVVDMREYDVKYFTRVAIDLGIFVGCWFDVSHHDGEVKVTRCDDSKYAPAMPRICAWDIETTKAPLKFPQPDVDQIYMISYMIDTKGFLIVNREIVSADIDSFEYTPRPEYEGHFDVFNEANEQALLQRWYSEMKKHKPLVYVTYNGDYFDFPFLQARSEFHGMNLRQELGFSMNSEGATLNPRLPHIDCFYWVKRDSYLPQGSQGLKAVTKAKLGFEPIEVDPEDMLPLARKEPQMMASYSVSDAVSTYYLYMKYVHPFIFSLCTIIPMAGDDVLRKGSGTLCESLLCVEAYAKNVIWPNKQVQVYEKFCDGHLIDSETYIGGRVEALESGVFRSDIPMKFRCNPDALQKLSDKLDEQLKFAIEVEHGGKLSDVTNYDEVRDDIRRKLHLLRDNPNVVETPLIYHLDVGAMYPNIILTNRLQPPSMVTAETCAGCCYNTPDNFHKCKRSMQWKWKGEMFTAGRHEYQRIKSQLETESFASAAVEKADAAATTKKTYGNKRGNVLEGTSFEANMQQRFDRNKGKGGGGGGGGYRQMNAEREREAREALLVGSDDGSDDSGEDENGNTHFHKLKENTQFSLLKKRMGEYSRKAYRKTHETKEILKTHTVCQRENSFYVDTVRLFRDRRYHYKREHKKWKDNLDKAVDPAAIKEAKSRVVQMESLQLAHKCILNSFYGYVMRKGSRWYSMEMAGVVTYLGAGLIMMARQLVQQLGITLELDTDGIWCCLPVSFPENFTFKTANPKKSISISYPCVMLNKDVQDRYTNDQYQDLVDGQVGNYSIRKECSIYFEVDGPYKAMVLPAAREEGKSIKKRYAVFHPDGRLAELKGFELKRRGELMLIKDFQSQVFRRFLDGTTLTEAFASAAKPANDALDMLYSKGEGYEDDEILAKLLESSNMTRRLAEYPATQKSMALTTARRIAEFLGPQMVKDKGLSCVFFVSRLPQGKPVTERPIPLNIYKADPAVRAHYLRAWTGDMSITAETSVRELLDWGYYIQRFNACVQKIISIPAALQHVANPVPRVEHPDWLKRVISVRSAKHKQVTLSAMGAWNKKPQVNAPLGDLEDIVVEDKASRKNQRGKSKVSFVDERSDEEDDVDDYDSSNHPDSEVEEDRAREEEERLRVEREAQTRKDAIDAFRRSFLRRDAPPMDHKTFAHEGFKPWLQDAQKGWLERVKLRKQLFTAMPGAAPVAAGSHQPSSRSLVQQQLSTQFVEKKAQAMAGTWHVLEVRDAPDRKSPCGVDVFVLVNQAPLVVRVQVEKTVYVDVTSPEVIPTIFGDDVSKTKIVTATKILPRHRTPKVLVEVDVSSMHDGGAALIDRLKHREDNVIDVYETHIAPSHVFTLAAGAICSVNSPVHLHRVANPLHPVPRDVYLLSELTQHSVKGYLGPDATGSTKKLRHAFVIHVTCPDTRGICAVFFPSTGRATVGVSVPPGAARPNINLRGFINDAAAAVGIPAANVSMENVEFTYHNDMRGAMGVVDQALDDSLKGPLKNRVQLAVVQSNTPTNVLASSSYLPSLSALASLRTPGAAEDDRILVTNPLTWVRDISRRAVHRYAASTLWVDERIAVASAASIPLCNITQDPYITAWDVTYSRALRQRHHVLWPGASTSATEEDVETRPTQASCIGGHVTWSVEFSVAQVDIVAVLFSQVIQEGDDPKTLALNDKGITSHFAILRHIVSELYGTAVRKDQKATALLVNFARWLRCTMSDTYDPVLVSHVNVLVTRVLAALLIRVTKLGGRIVRADRRSILIGTSKTSLHDCMQFAEYVLISLCDNAVLRHLAPNVARYWSTVLIVDKDDFSGMALDNSDALELRSSETISDVAVVSSKLQFHASLSFVSDYSDALKRVLWTHLGQFLHSVEAAKQQTEHILSEDATVTLATRYDRYLDVVLKLISDAIEAQFQPNIIRQVSEMLDDRELQQSLYVEPRLGGDSFGSEITRKINSLTAPVRVALRFFKDLCQLASLVPRCDSAVRKSRNNCLRLCNIGPFAPEATWEKFKRDVCVIQSVCGFCNESIIVDVGVQPPSGRPMEWTCPSCASPIATYALEAYLVRKCRSLLVADVTDDRYCPKCRQVSTSATMTSCTCGGTLKQRHEPPLDEARQLHAIALRHGMGWLEEVSVHLLETFGVSIPKPTT